MSALRWIRAVCSVVVCIAAIAEMQPATAQAAPARSAAKSALTKIVKAIYINSRVQSVKFGVRFGGSPVLVSALGDSVTGEPATTSMHNRPGIVQTEALDTILVKLVDERRVSLDTPLSTCFLRLPRAKYVTFRMLGNNRSVYGDYLADKAFLDRFDDNPFAGFSAAELIAIGMKQKMAFEPGDGFAYAHTNTVPLGAAQQCITGKTLDALIAQMIVEPLRLTQTFVPASADVPSPVQHLFYRDRGFFEDSTFWNPSWATYFGTIVSTLGDVAIMQRAFGSGRLVSRASFAQILAPTNARTPPQSKVFYFGLGVIVGNTWILQHAQVAGSDVVMGYVPERDLTIVVSTAIGHASAPASTGYSLQFFRDAANYLAPERLAPALFFKG